VASLLARISATHRRELHKLAKVKEEIVRAQDRSIAKSLPTGYGDVSNPSIRDSGCHRALGSLRIRVSIKNHVA
jgi:hypothetical protein